MEIDEERRSIRKGSSAKMVGSVSGLWKKSGFGCKVEA